MLAFIYAWNWSRKKGSEFDEGNSEYALLRLLNVFSSLDDLENVPSYFFIECPWNPNQGFYDGVIKMQQKVINYSINQAQLDIMKNFIDFCNSNIL